MADDTQKAEAAAEQPAAAAPAAETQSAVAETP